MIPRLAGIFRSAIENSRRAAEMFPGAKEKSPRGAGSTGGDGRWDQAEVVDEAGGSGLTGLTFRVNPRNGWSPNFTRSSLRRP